MSFKHITQRQIQFGTIAFLGVIVLTLGAIYFTRETKPSPQNLNNEELKWANRIQRLGGKEAYQELSAELKKLSPSDQHLNAHYFGKALYKQLGIEGISVCDVSFNFGCYHEFLGNAIYYEGIEVVEKLNEKCKKETQTLGCQHGIGHGVATYFGYSYENLVDSLTTCSTLPYSDPIGGCPGGVFMEYNFQTMLAKEGKIREFDTQSPYSPCDQLSETYKKSCYYWQTQWWISVLPGSPYEQYRKIGSLCSTLPEKTECYQGAGNMAGQSSYFNIPKTIALCHALNDTEGERHCRSTAVGSFLSIPEYSTNAHDICLYATASETKLCQNLTPQNSFNNEPLL